MQYNKMLGFIRRAAVDINDTQVRKVLNVTFVTSMLAFDSQVWSPQTVNNIVKIYNVKEYNLFMHIVTISINA
jgi:hypothetical protein